MSFIDMEGMKFGRLSVVSRAPSIGERAAWFCLCECGQTAHVKGQNLRRGVTRSCGCLLKETIRTKSLTHGMTRTPTWWTWVGLAQRCGNPRDVNYPAYGGRGVAVCERWEKFENFLEDMGIRPPGTSLDRQDNNKGYEPGNCVWATPTQQSRNRRNTKFLTAFGETKKVSEWREDSRCRAPQALYQRLRNGCPPELAITREADSTQKLF